MDQCLNDERLPPRFWAKVAVDRHGCWHWTGAKSTRGYGYIRVEGKSLLVHRVAYEALVDEIPPGHDLDHLCRNTSCANPRHVEPATRSVNVKRGTAPFSCHERATAITHCPRGHEYAGDNLIVQTTPRGHPNRICRTCKNAQKRARRALGKAN